MDTPPAGSSAAILASLVGIWRGRGSVSLPAMAPREYQEEVRFSARSPTSLDYWQRAVDAADGSMLHSEVGIWRVVSSGAIEISVALPGGTEVSEGAIGARSIDLQSTSVARSGTGARLVATIRRYGLEQDALAYEIEVATAGFALTGHLRGTLRRELEVG